MSKITHDVKPGNLNFCQICNSKNLKLIFADTADNSGQIKTDFL